VFLLVCCGKNPPEMVQGRKTSDRSHGSLYALGEQRITRVVQSNSRATMAQIAKKVKGELRYF